MSIKPHAQSGLCASVLSLCLLTTGCLMPLPGSKEIEGAAGAPEKKKIDLTFLKTGQTSRDEVLDKLGWANAWIKNRRLFLGRWVSSREWIWFAGSYTGAEGGSGRVKGGMHDLLIEFDEEGLVQQVREMPDSRLVQELHAWMVQAQEPPLDLSRAVEIEILRHHGNSFESSRLTLTRDLFLFHEPGNVKHDFRIAPEKIASVTSRGALNKAQELYDVGGTIYFKEKTAAGDKITFELAPSDLLVLVKYLQQVQPSALPNVKEKGDLPGAGTTPTGSGKKAERG